MAPPMGFEARGYSLVIDAFNTLILPSKFFHSLLEGLFPSGTSRKRNILLARSFLSRHAKPGQCAEEFHFFLIFRNAAIFRFIAADPLPVLAFRVEDFFRRRGDDAFAFFLRERRRVPPLLEPFIPPNCACCAGVSCANPAKPPGGGYLHAIFMLLREMRDGLYQHGLAL